MRILAVDVGAGTQDILLFDSSSIIENCVKIIMPSPTALVAQRIAMATKRGWPIMMEGVIMGGGPCKAALARHAAAGLAAYATEEAALTFDDDVEAVKAMGVTIISPDEVLPRHRFEVIHLRDLDLAAIRGALQAFGVEARFDAVAVAVLDHGSAPTGVSNRLLRYQYLQGLISGNATLGAFAHMAGEVPAHMARMKAVVKTAGTHVPVLVMDTGAAAALGALQDSTVAGRDRILNINLGNSHTAAYYLEGLSIKGLFEHHTGLLDGAKIDDLIDKLVRGVLTHEEVFDKGGHGTVIVTQGLPPPFMSVTGPRRDVARGSKSELHPAVPHGDTMLAGCYGLVKAFALRMESWREEIDRALATPA